MPKNIEMNVKQQDGSYEVIYPKTVTENVYNSSGQTVDQIVQQNAEDVLTVFKGIIVMWSGSQSNIPSGWVLCDGNNGTPDLRNRFIVGAGSTYDVNSTGGEATHALSVAEMPSHNHSVDITHLTISSDGEHTHTAYTWANSGNGNAFCGAYVSGYHGYGTVEKNGLHSHTLSGSVSITNTGSSQPHNNLPPYYALCYIMKT